MTPTVMTTEVVRFTLLGRGRPLAGQTFTLAAPPGFRLGLELTPRPTRTEFLKAVRLRLELQAVVEGTGLVASMRPAELLPAAAGVHQALRDLAGDLRGSSWAVQAWAAVPGMHIPGADPGAWMHLCAPWTTGVRPLLDIDVEHFPDDQVAVHTVRFWEADTRTGAQPWPQDWPAVNTVAGVQQPPRFRSDSHWSGGLVDLAPPEADEVPAPRAGVLAGY